MYIYFIKAGDGIKIGKTNNVKKRMGAIQNGNSNKLELIKHIWSCHSRCENFFHNHFKKYRISGEWFSAGIEPFIEDAINSAPRELGIVAESHYLIFEKLFSPNIADVEILNKITSFDLFPQKKRNVFMAKKRENRPKHFSQFSCLL